MRILVALDNNPYSRYVLAPVAKLAANTWAQVTFLGIGPPVPSHVLKDEHAILTDQSIQNLADTLDTCRELFFKQFREKESPYGDHTAGYHILPAGKNILNLNYPEENERKHLDIRMRLGNAAKEIIAESVSIEADLIVVGCDPKTGCKWANNDSVCEKIVKNADCSVFVVKENKTPEMIDCCLDQDTVSQASIELINQLITLYRAELEIIGVASSGGLKEDVDRRMADILAYYTSRDIKAWVKVVDDSSLNAFLSEAAEKNLVALWMGKTSFLSKLFPKQNLSKLVTTAQSSVLILR